MCCAVYGAVSVAQASPKFLMIEAVCVTLSK